MGMLIFFIISLIGGVVAGYYAERVFKSEDSFYHPRSKQHGESVLNRLMKISRQIN